MDKIIEVLLNNLPAISGMILGVGLIWNRFSKVLVALKEVTEFLTSIVVSFEDKELTKEEIQTIKKEGIEALSSLKAIFK